MPIRSAHPAASLQPSPAAPGVVFRISGIQARGHAINNLCQINHGLANTLVCCRAYAGVVAGQSTAVESAHPPAAMLRVSNPVVQLLLRSSAGGPMRKQFMVLRFTGRKTGRRYDIPVVAHRQAASCTR